MNVESAAKCMEDRIRINRLLEVMHSRHFFKWHTGDSYDGLMNFHRAVAEEYVPATVLLIEGLDNWLNPEPDLMPAGSGLYQHRPKFWEWVRFY